MPVRRRSATGAAREDVATMNSAASPLKSGVDLPVKREKAVRGISMGIYSKVRRSSEK